MLVGKLGSFFVRVWGSGFSSILSCVPLGLGTGYFRVSLYKSDVFARGSET